MNHVRVFAPIGVLQGFQGGYLRLIMVSSMIGRNEMFSCEWRRVVASMLVGCEVLALNTCEEC